jgi:electron transfer flavoprotein beta subunit
MPRSMNIAVLVKQVPDPNQPYALEGGRIKREGTTPVLDPGDEFGVEAALQLTEKHGGEVTVISMGPAKAIEAVRRALSMGAHRAILVTDDKLAGADGLTTARVLAAAIRRASPDLVIAGAESTDGSMGTVPGTIAGLLDFPQATVAKRLEVRDGTIVVYRQTERGHDVVEAPLPALVTVTAAVAQPRYPSFKGIMAAKSRPLEQLSVADLGLSDDDVRPTQSVSGTSPAPERGAGEVVEDTGDGAERIADFLTRAKVL